MTRDAALAELARCRHHWCDEVYAGFLAAVGVEEVGALAP
jgi:hypothetical protein